MNEIKFRAKSTRRLEPIISAKTWVYLDLFGKCFDMDIFFVKPKDIDADTIGLYTGVANVFVGDIFKWGCHVFVVKFGLCRDGHQAFYADATTDTDQHVSLRQDLPYWLSKKDVHIIGNIHDNPELLNK